MEVPAVPIFHPDYKVPAGSIVPMGYEDNIAHKRHSITNWFTHTLMEFSPATDELFPFVSSLPGKVPLPVFLQSFYTSIGTTPLPKTIYL